MSVRKASRCYPKPPPNQVGAFPIGWARDDKPLAIWIAADCEVAHESLLGLALPCCPSPLSPTMVVSFWPWFRVVFLSISFFLSWTLKSRDNGRHYWIWFGFWSCPLDFRQLPPLSPRDLTATLASFLVASSVLSLGAWCSSGWVLMAILLLCLGQLCWLSLPPIVLVVLGLLCWLWLWCFVVLWMVGFVILWLWFWFGSSNFELGLFSG